jgi:hypothetical protein
MNIFEKASQSKLRFITPIGNLSVEDMWGVDLSYLDHTAKAVNRAIKDAEEESFLEPVSKASEEDILRLDILKHIIGVRLEMREQALRAVQRKEKRQQILAIIKSKQDAALGDKSIEDLEQMLEEI